MNYYAWKPDTKNGKKALEMTLRILDAMDDGGIHDHVGQVNYKLTLLFWIVYV